MNFSQLAEYNYMCKRIGENTNKHTHKHTHTESLVHTYRKLVDYYDIHSLYMHNYSSKNVWLAKCLEMVNH